MIDIETQEVYYTPIFYILAQLSKSIRPGDVVVNTEMLIPDSMRDSFYSCASINENKILNIQLLNVEKEDVDLSLQIGDQYSSISIGANSLQTISIQM